MQVYLDGHPEVTFNKKIYRRYTKINSWKKHYSIDPNTNVFPIDFDTESANEKLIILKNLWIEANQTTLDSIEKISVILVPEFEVPYTFEIVKYAEHCAFPRLFAEDNNGPNRNPRQIDPFDWNALERHTHTRINFNQRPNQDPNADAENIACFACSQSLNPSQIKLLAINPSASLEQILNIKNTMLVSSVSVQMLKFIESYINTTEKSNYLQIPISDVAFVSKLISKSKYRLILHFEKSQPTQINLVAKYSMVQDRDEIRRFEQLPHEYLSKRYVESSIIVKPNENNEVTIDPKFTQIPLCTVVVASPVKLEEIKIKSTDGIDYDFECSQTNPENPLKFTDTKTNPSKPNRWFYTLDQLCEKYGFDCGSYQPSGSYTFDRSNPIRIKFSEKSDEIKLDIMYLSYEVIRYMIDNFIGLLSYLDMYKQQIAKSCREQMNELVAQEQILTFEEFADHYYSWVKSVDLTAKHFAVHLTSVGDNDADQNSIITYEKYKELHEQAHPELYRVEQEEPVNNLDIDIDLGERIFDGPIFPGPAFPIPSMDYDNKKFSRFLKLYSNQIYPILNNAIELIEKSEAKEEKLSEDVICEILLEPIKPGSYYYMCETCNGKFDTRTYKTWIEDPDKSGKCPKCQTQINTIPQMYINK